MQVTTQAQELKAMEREQSAIARTLTYDSAHITGAQDYCQSFVTSVAEDTERLAFLNRRITAIRRQLGIIG